MLTYRTTGALTLVVFALLMAFRPSFSGEAARAAIAVVAGGFFGIGLLLILKSNRHKP
jgi:ABC-type Mn2+/Zn2+ transport system permease subunit